ncbi:MAG: ribonuclease P, partial [Nanoarchaeota archaeon]|nr:ribonuclease P [Nanoarchaeota archaeon]
MARAYKKKPGEQTDIARERMKILLQKAEDVFNEDRSLANRYIELARKISMKFKVRMPSELKRKICPHCYIFL